MHFLHGLKVIVKNTFLEIVEPEEEQPSLAKSQTDSVTLCSRVAREGDVVPVYDNKAFSDTSPRLKDLVMGRDVSRPAAAGSLAIDFEDRGASDAAGALACGQGLKARAEVPLPAETALGSAQGGADDADAAGSGAKGALWPLGSKAKAKKPSLAKWAVGHAGEDAANTDGASSSAEPGLTTVMLRNLPNNYTRAMLLALLDDSGFAGRYDFVYLPIDFGRNAGLGYAFVNMLTPDDAQAVQKRLDGFRRWVVSSGKVCKVGWSDPWQGLETNVERYRNSPLMHSCVPDEFKPVVFADGERVRFPKPTKRLRKPDFDTGKPGV